MLTDQESYLIKTIIDSLTALGGDTREINKALNLVLDYNKLSLTEKQRITTSLLEKE